MTSNQVVGLCKYIDRMSLNGTDHAKLKHDLIKNSALLAATYRKLITWLVRLPFTKLKPFEKFRDEINNKMKVFFKLFRKKINETSYDEIRQSV
jgi:hypothetical protein